MSLSSDGTVMTMPVQPANTGNGNGWGFGGDGAWWIIILFLFVFCGWGGNWGNNGFGGGNGAGAVDGYILTSDFANIERKIDVVNNGLCDGFYAQAQLVNGVQNAMQQGFMSAEISRANQQAAFMQQLNAMQMQQANCCCETREAIQGVNYNMSQNTCALQNTMNSNTRDIIDSQQAGTRAILDYLCQEKISSLQAENNDLRRAASQDRQSALLTTAMSAQTQQIINAVNPAAIPAYVVPNPNAYAYGCGCNTGCSC